MFRHAYQPLVGAVAVLILAVLGLVFVLDYHGFHSSSSSASVRGSGVAATESRTLPTFSGVELGGSNTVTIVVDGRQSVVVHADDNLLDKVTTTVHDGRLVIGNTPGSFETKAPMYVDVHARSLTALGLSGSGVVSATGVQTDSFALTLDGSGVARVDGTTGRLEVQLRGSGDAQLNGLTARTVHAVVSGSGRILTTVTQRLDAAVPGSGVIVYSGDPAKVTTDVTGSGVVTRG